MKDLGGEGKEAFHTEALCWDACTGYVEADL